MPPRHIKVIARLLLGSKEVELRIVEQSHFGENFSKKGMSSASYHHSGCFHNDGVLLIGMRGYTSCYEKVYVGGVHTYIIIGDKLDSPFLVPLSEWKSVRAAFLAYNAWGATTED